MTETKTSQEIKQIKQQALYHLVQYMYHGNDVEHLIMYNDLMDMIE